MQSMGNWDYAAIMRELRLLEGAFFDKFYTCVDGSTLLKLRKKGAFAIVANAFRLHATNNPPETLQTPPQFVMVVRKWLENSTLKKVEQLNEDRIIRFEFQRKDGKIYKLIFELFAKGNVILLSDENEVVDVLAREEFATRKLKPREVYVLPPARKAVEELTPANFKPAGKTVAAIASNASVPPFYVEEALARTQVNENAAKLSEKEKQTLITELQKMKSEFSPVIYFENEKPIAFSFTHLTKFKELEKKEFSIFSQALDEYFKNAEPGPVSGKAEKKVGDKIASRLEFQRKAVENFKEKERENREAAELICSKYELFEELLASGAKLIAQKTPVEKIESELIEIAKKNGEKAEIKIKNGKIEVEVLA